jgi:diacylglycerol kinase (ATP)
MKKKMCNYFSIGVESRIGLGFDRKRTTSPFLNKVVYCWEGFKKMFMKTQPMHIVIESLEKFDKNEKNNLKV